MHRNPLVEISVIHAEKVCVDKKDEKALSSDDVCKRKATQLDDENSADNKRVKLEKGLLTSVEHQDMKSTSSVARTLSLLQYESSSATAASSTGMPTVTIDKLTIYRQHSVNHSLHVFHLAPIVFNQSDKIIACDIDDTLVDCKATVATGKLVIINQEKMSAHLLMAKNKKMLRALVTARTYTAIQLLPGKSVGLIDTCHDVIAEFPPDTFDLVIFTDGQIKSEALDYLYEQYISEVNIIDRENVVLIDDNEGHFEPVCDRGFCVIDAKIDTTPDVLEKFINDPVVKNTIDPPQLTDQAPVFSP